MPISQTEVATLVQAIIDRAPSYQANGKTYYVLERCISVEEDNLQSYAEATLTPVSDGVAGEMPLELVGATVNGKLMRWTTNTQLTWWLDEASFPDEERAQQCLTFAEQAGSDWNEAAESGGLDIRFSRVDSESDALFNIVYEKFDSASLFAVAFFPHEPVWGRVVRVGPAMFAQDAGFDPVGVLRHEFGHVLGFRHEHIRPEAPQQIEPWVVGEIGAEELSKYDRRSLMHYPMGDAGTNDFNITEHDRKGFIKLYTLAQNSVEEFEA